jgi:alcohol dehydrogenase
MSLCIAAIYPSRRRGSTAALRRARYLAAMLAWRVLEDGSRELATLPDPSPAPGGVVVRMQAAPVLSYLRKALEGALGYALPPRPFIPGTNGIGTIVAIGAGVRHLAAGERVCLDPHLVADERVAEPAQILIGLTAMGAARFDRLDPAVLSLQQAWRDGTFAELAHLPAAVVTPLPFALRAVPAERLAGISKLAVPYGGFRRGALEAGETVVVNGATGYFGSGAVLVALALGASRVVAAGRDRAGLDALAKVCGPRVAPVALTGDPAQDAARLRDAAGGGADLTLDMVGRAESSAATSAALHALRRGGRLVLMGSVKEPLALAVGEMLANEWRVMGCFMYPEDAPARLAAMCAAGALDLGAIRARTFPLRELPAALDAAAAMRGLDLTAVVM